MGTLPARGPTAQAIGYALKHWDRLERFLHDGRIEMGANTVERTMRPVALSRKKCVIRGERRGGGQLGRHRIPDRDLQAEHRRAATLPHRDADPPGEWLATGTHRRAHAMELGCPGDLLIIRKQ